MLPPKVVVDVIQSRASRYISYAVFAILLTVLWHLHRDWICSVSWIHIASFLSKIIFGAAPL